MQRLIALGLSPSYVLDDMQMYEVDVCLGAYKYEGMALQEITRRGAVLSLAPFTKEGVEPAKVLPLLFEEREEDDDEWFDTEELLNRSKKLIKEIKRR